MGYLNIFEKTSFLDRWLLVKHSKDFVEPDSMLLILKLYAVRFVAVLLVAVTWATVTLSTGIFTVGMVIMLGMATGSAHFLLGQRPQRFHLLNALLVTVFGGVLCNVLAGLAFFSSKMGVSYWQVLVANFNPDNLRILKVVFLQSLLPEDLIYYMAAITSVFFFAQHYYFHGLNYAHNIEVQLVNGKVYHLGLSALNTLLSMGRIVGFKRSDGWTVVGRDPLRSMHKSTSYSGTDRRLTS